MYTCIPTASACASMALPCPELRFSAAIRTQHPRPPNSCHLRTQQTHRECSARTGNLQRHTVASDSAPDERRRSGGGSGSGSGSSGLSSAGAPTLRGDAIYGRGGGGASTGAGGTCGSPSRSLTRAAAAAAAPPTGGGASPPRPTRAWVPVASLARSAARSGRKADSHITPALRRGDGRRHRQSRVASLSGVAAWGVRGGQPPASAPQARNFWSECPL